MKKNIIILVVSLVFVFALLIAGLLALVVLKVPQIAKSKEMPEPVAANIMKAADPEMLSKPLDPWSIEAVDVDTMYLVFPLLKDGKTSDLGYSLKTEIQEGVIQGFSRSMGISRGSYTDGMIKRMSDYSADNEIELTESVIEDIIEFSNPTHVISGSYDVADGRWQISICVEAGEEKWTQSFDIPEGHLFEARREIVVWMVECGALKVVEDAVKILPYGENVDSYESELYKEMSENPRHEEWDALVDLYGENDFTRFFRISAAVMGDDREMVRGLMPETLDESASFYAHMSRMKALKYLEMLDASCHERELILSKYPGVLGQGYFYIHHTFSIGQKRDRFLRGVEEWSERVPRYPLVDVMKGEAYTKAAWDYRGGGYANTVTSNAWKKFSELGEKGIVSLESAMGCGIPEPYAVSKPITLKMAVGNAKGEARKLHEQTCTRYPDQSETWYTYLNFMRPRWGGSSQQVVTMIDQAMVTRPDNYRFGLLAIVYHDGEASLGKGSSGWSYFRDYCNSYPAAKKQIVQSVERMSGEGSSEFLIGYSLSVASMLEDREMIRGLLQDYPNGFDCLTEHSCQHGWFGRSRSWVLYEMLSLGQWDNLKKALKSVREDDQKYRKDSDKKYCVTFWGDRYALDGYEAMAIAMDGEPERGIALLEEQLDGKHLLSFLPYVRAHYACLKGEDYKNLEIYTEKYPKDPDPYYIRALYYLKTGEHDRALKEVEGAKALTGSAWVSLKAEVMELLEKTEPASVAE